MADERNADQSSAESRLQRQRALRELANQQEQRDAVVIDQRPRVQLGTGTPDSSRSRRHAVLSAIAGLLLFGIIATVVVYERVQPDRPGSATTVATPQIIPGLTDLVCEQDIAWSPDGARIAIVGYQRACATDSPFNYAYWPGRVEVFAAKTHKLLAQNQPDSAIAAALHLPAPIDVTPSLTSPLKDTSAQVIHYSHVQWSPDSNSLAVSFTIFSIDGPAVNGIWPTHTIVGLYLSSADGSNARVLARTVAKDECFCGAEWNVRSGTLTAISPLPPGSNNSNWLSSLTPPAIMYSWGEGGHLTGTPALTANGAPFAPSATAVGNPDGGASFSIWQPGVIGGQRTDAMQLAQIPPVATFSTSFLAWSPDGQYVLDVEAQSWRVAAPLVPTPSVDSLRTTGLAAAPILPSHDAVVADMLSPTPMHVHNPYGSGEGIELAWSPNGRLVAVVESIGTILGQPNPGQLRLVVFDAASASPLVALTPHLDTNVAASAHGAIFLRWSADGSHLLFFDEQLGVLSIFGPGQLPSGRD